MIQYCQVTQKGFRPYEFHQCVCRALEWAAASIEAGIPIRLILEAPPQHGKTELVAVKWPTWLMERIPGIKVIVGSYSQTLASETSIRARQARDAATEWADGALPIEQRASWLAMLPRDNGKDTVEKWETANTSSYKAVGIDGPVTGAGADCFIIDDYCKDAASADSALKRSRVWEWYKSVALTRLSKRAAVVIMATRWHQDDLIGRVLEEHAHENWVRIRFPAIAEDDSDFRAEGEALCPEMKPLEWLENTRKSVGTRWWLAMFQQRPTSREGGIIKRAWVRYYRELPAVMAEQMEEIGLTVDPSVKDNPGSDPVSIQAWGRLGTARYLLNDRCHRMALVDTIKAIGEETNTWRPSFVLCEDKANGSPIIELMYDWFMRQGVRLIGVKPRASKSIRLESTSPQWESLQIWLPDPELYPWVLDYQEEVFNFPAKHDDRVDTTSQLLIYWREEVEMDWSGLVSFSG